MFQTDPANPIKTIHAVNHVPFLGRKLFFFFQAYESHECDLKWTCWYSPNNVLVNATQIQFRNLENWSDVISVVIEQLFLQSLINGMLLFDACEDIVKILQRWLLFSPGG